MVVVMEAENPFVCIENVREWLLQGSHNRPVAFSDRVVIIWYTFLWQFV
mgnify:CR=1 FL=1